MGSLFGRRYWPFLVAIAALLVFQLWPRDDRRITTLLSELCSKLNQTHDEDSWRALEATLRADLLPEVQVTCPELGPDLYRVDGVILRARELLGAPRVSFSFVDAEVRVSGALARATGNLLVTPSGSGEQHRDLRRTVISLKRAGSDWRIERIAVDPAGPDQPEPRP